MRGKKWYEWILTLVYIAMVALCVFLNLSAGHQEGLENIIINAAMFVIIGIVFLNCQRHSFAPVNSIVADLNRLSERIRQDAMNSHQFLWDQYKEEKDDLFTDKILKKEYSDYLYEQNRIATIQNAYYKCDIEDYINSDLIDSVIHRNMLNQVAGALTGLGILGTFIGLSLGLQNFNTGTSAEITSSIAPLMNGIKVAFHTSIYGMVFSLTFNYVFKRKVDEAEKAVDQFISIYKKYVLPDTTTDGVNKLMELQQQQTAAIKDLALTVGHQLSEGLAELLEPQFDRFDATLKDFVNVATGTQKEAMAAVVNQFIADMNESLNGAFGQLSYTIDKSMQMQQESAAKLSVIMDKSGNTALSLAAIERSTNSIIRAMDQYTVSVEKMQKQLTDSMVELERRTNDTNAMIDQEQKYLAGLTRYRKALDEAAENLTRQLQEQEKVLTELRDLSVQTPKSVDETFRIIDQNLVDVEKHFEKTITQIKEATERVPEVVNDSYAGIEDAYDRAADAMEQLSVTIDKLAHDFYKTSSRR